MLFRIVLITAWAFVCFPSTGHAQKTHFGIQFGNNLSIPSERISPNFSEGYLPRYAIGFLARTRIKENWRFHLLTPVRKGAIDFDYGLNLVFKGFDYKFGTIDSHRDRISFEVPLLIQLTDERSVFASRKWHRKGISTYVRLGFKPSYTPKETYTRSIAKTDEVVTESIEEGGFNVLGSYSIGVVRRKKNELIMFLEFSLNIGFIKNTSGIIELQNSNGQVIDQVPYSDSGSYFSLNTGYFLKGKNDRKRNTKKLPPLIYSPRY